MIEDSKEESFDLVLVHKLDRFARNRQDSIGYRMELKRHGVSLISILEYLDDESPESGIIRNEKYTGFIQIWSIPVTKTYLTGVKIPFQIR